MDGKIWSVDTLTIEEATDLQPTGAFLMYFPSRRMSVLMWGYNETDTWHFATMSPMYHSFWEFAGQLFVARDLP